MISPINVKVNKYELVVKWCIVLVVVMGEAAALTGPNVCLEKQKYNITKRVKYRAPMSVRTYEWCLAMPPRCSRWHTEMRNLTRLETEERTADVEVCCPGYKIKDISCIPICPHGKTGHNCLSDCPPNKWGPNCAHDCKPCLPPSACSPLSGDCVCLDGWQGESCEFRMSTSTTTQRAEILTTSTPPTIIVENTTHSTKFKNTSFTENITISTSTSTVESTTPTFSTSETGQMSEITEATTPLTSETTKTDIFDTRDSTKPIVTTTSGTTKISTEKESILYRVPILSATTQQPTAKLINSSKVETTTSSPKTSTVSTIVTKPVTETPKDETTRKTEAVSKFPTTLKFKPKEIWIRPATKEPEHITAIATDKAQERTSVDLISVLSIAGGVMFAVITVAVIIVMIERCRRPRYEDVRKMDNIRMKVLMDEEDLPPPYVTSIFHTPLPEPPVGEKCHYQPISTLDRNLKQFMRPVVVQTISPIMIENFRGILECHYDHLPRRSHAFDSSQCDLRCSLAPSVSSATEPLCSRATSMIDAIKCEAKLDEIDSTTSEPLYAEIPAWRPPSEHAIEVMNINGEACTEL